MTGKRENAGTVSIKDDNLLTETICGGVVPANLTVQMVQYIKPLSLNWVVAFLFEWGSDG